mmetsp:Transcript_17760/g.29851  ORF Transcript_17760/g.29851 Transcript_17760/m.29851 type:complete len:1373 (-) Transcript_17760:276-4394(-)|eukprot:CAMPEP_0198199932 /NCGR_PEP_ID=MMETSP1445-20131203/3034_1 /TAXON_ID=36898 /ORGANISM="Pyramimonas sp., Strain CCMP2087" /LENGTH=1372 /DNA_ID=CAMNT_0043869843 /DNA_START=44 /DNA_END=4162 /DNA_ORIENTATION=+
MALSATNAEQVVAVLVAARLAGVSLETTYADGKEPTLDNEVTGLAAIAKAVAAKADASSDFYANKDEIDQWMALVDDFTPKGKEGALEKLNSHLENKTYIVGSQISLADVFVACLLPANFKQAILAGGKNEHTSKWLQAVMEDPKVSAVMDEVLPKKELDAAGEAAKDAKKAAKLAEKDAKKAKAEAKKKANDEAAAAKAAGKAEGGGNSKKAAEAAKKAAAAAEKEVELISALAAISETPFGAKKNVKTDMLSQYHPKVVEAAWYEWWEKCEFFKAQNGTDKPKFVIVIPPPNVTGTLHLGHALTNAVQDTIVRWKKMSGYEALWVPGTDHAGIATQTVVEKKIMKERKQTRHDLGREAFLKEVWKWKEESGSTICRQLRRLGSSLDWSRECFTMDDKLSAAVNEAFVRMHEKKLIYRQVRLVNWCCTLKTCISDIEVDFMELEGTTMLPVPGYADKVEFGCLTSFAYPLEDGSGELVVATTRVETMLGDTAVAVHPEDPRYTAFHGKKVKHPFNGRLLPIILDAELVDMSFGTGAVKITPAHDPNDFATAKRHDLEMINIFTDLGAINENGGDYQGMPRFEVRTKIVGDLEKLGLFRGKTDNPMRVPMCSRSKDIIEPLIKPQWWVDCTKMAADACEVVRDGTLEVLPRQFEATWFRWLENIRDWCISRQLWWGHRIPAYYITLPTETEEYIGTNETMDRWVVGRTYEDALEIAHARFPNEEITLTQDPDVLDTWFSSGLFPFSVMGWPNQTADLADFFPGALLETGHDILFFWVARMVMMSITLMGKVPFKQVYLHAMVRDAHGRKMSKSLGNVIDPIQVIEGITLEGLHLELQKGNLDPKEIKKAEQGQKEDFPEGIPECGTDALRFALVAYTTQARDINLDIQRVHGYRTWCNKLWNAIRFAMMNLPADFLPTAALGAAEVAALPMAGQWIISRLNKAVAATVVAMDKYDFATSTTAVYAFWQYDLCDVFIELMKPLVQATDKDVVYGVQNALWWALDAGLRLLHPFMPFITEELWQRLPRRAADLVLVPSIMLASYPAASEEWAGEEVEREMALLQDITKCLRSARSNYGLTLKQKTAVYVSCNSDATAAVVSRGALYISTLSSSSSVTAVRDATLEVPAGCAVSIVSEECSAYLMLKGIMNLEEELAKLDKRKGDTTKAREDLDKRMALDNYKSNVPKSVQAADTDKASKLAGELATIEEAMAAFTKLKLEEAQGGEANGVPEGADESLPPTSEGAVLRVNVASCNIKKIDLKAYGIDTAICQVCLECEGQHENTKELRGLDPTWEENFYFRISDPATVKVTAFFKCGGKQIGDKQTYPLDKLLQNKPTFKAVIVPGGKADMLFSATNFGDSEAPKDDDGFMDFL